MWSRSHSDLASARWSMRIRRSARPTKRDCLLHPPSSNRSDLCTMLIRRVGPAPPELWIGTTDHADPSHCSASGAPALSSPVASQSSELRQSTSSRADRVPGGVMGGLTVQVSPFQVAAKADPSVAVDSPPTVIQNELLTHDTEVMLTAPGSGGSATLLHEEPSQTLDSGGVGGVSLPWIGPTFMQNEELVHEREFHVVDRPSTWGGPVMSVHPSMVAEAELEAIVPSMAASNEAIAIRTTDPAQRARTDRDTPCSKGA